MRTIEYVGFLERLGLTKGANALAPVTSIDAARNSRIGISSPWSTGSLTEFVYSDVFGDSTLYPPTRAQAMSLPAVVNGRSLIVGELAGRPLRAIRNGEAIPKQHAWLYRTSSELSPWHRMANTIDDLMFYGDSLWAVERGADKQITDALRLTRDRWRFDSNGVIEVTVDGTSWFNPAKSDVIYFPGAFEGLLTVASRTIRSYINLEAAWSNQAATPLPSIILAQREQGELDAEEVTKIVTQTAEARRNPNGGVMFVPFEYIATVEGVSDPQMLVEARNAVKLDVANFLGIDANMLDAALPKASLNYETQEGTQTAFQNRLPYWTGPIEARLSMDDVCPRGQRIAFDFSTNPTEPGDDTGPYQED